MRIVLAMMLATALGFVPAPEPRVIHAEQGVALDQSSIRVDDALLRDHAYRLPPILVINPGDEPSTYRMYAEAVVDGGREPADPAWFAFEPAEFHLDPQTSQEVTVRILVTGDAPPDGYSARIGAGVVAEGQGTRIGLAAAAPVSFDVRSTNTWENIRRGVEDAADSSLLFIAIGVAVVGAGLVAWRMRRMRLRVEWRS